MVNELRARELGRSPEHHQRAHRAPANPKHPRVLPAMFYSAISAVARAPAAAASSTPASRAHPVRSFLLRWMRKSTGYAPVVSASPAAACSSSPASSRRSFGRRRPNSGEVDVARLISTNDAINTTPQPLTVGPVVGQSPGQRGISPCVTDVWPPHVRFDPGQPC